MCAIWSERRERYVPRVGSRELPGRWHNGSAFIFCLGDCPFKSESSPTSAQKCGEVTSCVLAAKRSACVAPEVDLGECILHSLLQEANKAEHTLTLKHRGDITRNPKQGYQWPQKGHVSAKKLLKKRKQGGVES